MIFNLMLFFPLLGMIFFVLFGRSRFVGLFNIIFSLITFITSICLGFELFTKGSLLFWSNQFYIDNFSIIMLVLTTFISVTVAIFSNNYMQHNLDSGRINLKIRQLYYVMYQAFIGTMLLVYSSNNIGILWVAVEGATLSTVLLVSLYRTPASIEAAWKYFILCIVGIALALFGTACVYFSANNISTNISGAMLWTTLYQHATLLDPKILTIAFVFLLVGYGTKVGLVPFHFWLPDAHSESPAPMSALLSGLLLNVGVYALVRFKMLVDPTVANHLAGHLMMAFGLLSFVVAGFFIYRQWNIKRMFSYSSIEHLGLITFSFGLGGPIATFVGLFYMIVHSLVKSAIFMSVGNVIQLTASQDMNKIRGLINMQPTIGWTLLISTMAIAGFPPFGIFNSELMLIITTIKQNIFLSLIIIFGLIVVLAGLLKNLQPVIFGHGTKTTSTAKISLSPIILNLSLALCLGLYIPPVLYHYLQQATLLISGAGILS